MSFLVALAAFAAVFAVYSTVVTVLVEAIHKAFGLRSAGMSEMLRAFYDHYLAALQPPGTAPEALAPIGARSARASPQSDTFANLMSRRSASESLRPWYVRRWPGIGALFSSRQVRMTTLQFIERLAETPQGAALARHDPARLRSALTAAAYSFERLGEVQGLYFKARAKVLAVITGIAVAIFVNLDAIALYKELSINAQLSARLALLAGSPAITELEATALNAAGPASDAVSLDINSFTSLALDLKAMGVPVGRSMFPHCQGYEPAAGSAATAESFADGGYRDPRCGGRAQASVNEIWARSYSEFAAGRPGGVPEAFSTESRSMLQQAGLWLEYRWQRIRVIGHNPQTFMMWALGVLISGGLLGLGAPFWFNLFARAANIAAPAARAALLPTASQPAPMVGARSDMSQSVRPVHTSRAEDLERGFRISLGGGVEIPASPAPADPPPGEPPAGFSIGAPPPGFAFGVPPPVTEPQG